MAGDLWRLDATELAGLIRQRDISAREAVQAHLDRMHKVNPALNAVVRDLSEQALAEADAADARLRGGAAVGPLHGVPITTKINTDQEGLPTDNGVLMAKDLIANEDNPVIGTLRKAGAIVIGRTNAPAFSMRLTTDNALHGLTLNPWNKDVTCGGSSGGAGSSLAVGIGAIAQGNDIGGSVRWPAYCNGLVGLRPTIGRIAAFNETGARTADRGFAGQLMAVNGPLTRSVRDAELALSIMAASDARDPLWTDAPLKGPAGTKRAALVIEDDLPDVTKAAVRCAGGYLEEAGYTVDEATPPSMERLVPLWGDIAMCEFGFTLSPLASKIGDDGMAAAFGAFTELMGHNDAQRFLAAMRERDTILRKWSEFLSTYDVVILPALGARSLAVGCDVQGADAMKDVMHKFRFQLGLPVLGLPVLAVPMGVSDGLPMGVQILSAKFREDRCIAAGRIIEMNEPPIAPIDPVF
ncbi:MAG TPA: amidase [Rhizomicrobium sp.]|jgi:amidase|nr:amidase [Rhizomicrobium sp.]